MSDRRLIVSALAMALSLACGAAVQAQDLAKVDPARTPATLSSPAAPSQALYQLCTFYPKPGTCEMVYRRASRDGSVTAQAVKAEYNGYARYLHGRAGLTDADRRFLQANAIRLPAGLSPLDQAGLHNLLNQPGLDAQARRLAANNFLSRAVEARLYCDFNACGEGTAAAASEIG